MSPNGHITNSSKLVLKIFKEENRPSYGIHITMGLLKIIREGTGVTRWKTK